MDKKIKSGKEILDDFFENVSQIEGVDKSITELLKKLYDENNLTDASVKNALVRLRNPNASKN